MSQHGSLPCSESTGLWLPIIEYSIKSGVSLSTIRRKIKSNSIPYRLEKGKYLLLFQEESGSAEVALSRLTPLSTPLSAVPHPTIPRETGLFVPPPSRIVHQARLDHIVGPSDPGEESVKMLTGAFENALREKEDRIHLLEKQLRDHKERLAELRVLVELLEKKYGVQY